MVKTTLSMIPMGGVKFSWPVAREKLTEGSLSHGSQFLTEHREVNGILYFPELVPGSKSTFTSRNFTFSMHVDVWW